MRAYPAPDRHRWSVMIEHLDGSQVVGTSDADALDRWRRLHWASPEMSAAEFKTKIASAARILYGCALIGIGPDTPDDQFLDALAAEGAIEVIRKG